MVILCDFDDTAADRNIATLLLDRFQPDVTEDGAPHWLELHQRFLNKEITLAHYQEIAFSRLRTPLAELASHVQAVGRLRPGFRELAAYCDARGIPLVIVSHGLDFYIRALLQAEGLPHIPSFAVRAAQSKEGWEFRYEFADEACGWWPGNCKCSIVQRYRQAGEAVIYAGDGSSDVCPARHADYVFARDTLLRTCREEGLPHQELTDFHVVLDYVKSVAPEAIA